MKDKQENKKDYRLQVRILKFKMNKRLKIPQQKKKAKKLGKLILKIQLN